MKKFARWRLWLEGSGIAGLLLCGALHAAPPPDVVIATGEDAQAFQVDTPFVFAGQSLLVHTSFAAGRPVELQRLAPVMVASGQRFELNGVVSSGAPPMGAVLEKRGTGTLVLAGENVYTSNTVLREGGLHLKGGSALGSAIYNLEQQAGTVLQLEPGARVPNLIQVAPLRPGDEPLPGLEEQAVWQVDAGLATLANNVNALIPVRKVGAGALRLTETVQSLTAVHVDAGALVVDGAVTARVEVGAGARLEGRGGMVAMDLGSGAMVAPAGREAAGTLEIWGDAVFAPGSLYHVNAQPEGQADLLQVMGAARLDGSVWAEAGAGEWAPDQRYLILSAGGGLGDTRFAGVQANLAFLDPELEYDADHVYLALRRNDLSLGDVGDTPDDREVGDVIDPPHPPAPQPPEPPAPPQPPAPPPPGDPVVPPAPAEPAEPVDPPEPAQPSEPGDSPEPVEPFEPVDPAAPPGPSEPPVASGPTPPPYAPAPSESPAASESADPPPADTGDAPPPPGRAEPAPLNPLRDAMLGLSHEQARAALRGLTGSWHASLRSFMLNDTRYVRDAVLASAPGQMLWSAYGVHTGNEAGLRHSGVRGWGQVYTAAGRRAAASGVFGDDHSSKGLVLGLDAPVASNWRLGGVLAVQHARLSREGLSARASVESNYAGLSAYGDWNGWRVTMGLLHAWHRFDSRREARAGALRNVLSATYTGRSWQAVMELAPQLRKLRDWSGRLQWAGAAASLAGSGPYLRHAWMRLQLPAYTESGGAAAHNVAASTTSMHATTLGWRYRHGFQWRGQAAAVLAEAGWRHVGAGARVTSTQRFFGGQQFDLPVSRQFVSSGLPLPRHALAVGLALHASPHRQATLAARYSGLFGAGMRDHAAWAELRWAF